MFFRPERGDKRGRVEEIEGLGSCAPVHRDVMMGWDELGFAGGLSSVFEASAALRGCCFGPHGADTLPVPI